VLLRWLANEPKFGEEAMATISDPKARVFLSAATVWEISIKKALGKLEVPFALLGQIELNRFQPLSITVSHVYAAESCRATTTSLSTGC